MVKENCMPGVSSVKLHNIVDWMLLPTCYLTELSRPDSFGIAQFVEHWHVNLKVAGSTLGLNISYTVAIFFLNLSYDFIHVYFR